MSLRIVDSSHDLVPDARDADNAHYDNRPRLGGLSSSARSA